MGHNDTWPGANPLPAVLGGYEATIFALSSSGAYQWHTFYRSSSSDEGRAVAVGDDGGVQFAGWSRETWQGDDNTTPVHAFSGDTDAVAVKLELVESHPVFIPLVMGSQ